MAGWALVVLASIATWSCGSDVYSVRVEWAEGVALDRASYLEIHLVESCESQPADPTEPASGVLRSLEGERGAEFGSFGRLGDARPGGLLAIASSNECSVVARGCTPLALEPGGGGELLVVLAPPEVSRCRSDQMCELGVCRDILVEGPCDVEETDCDVEGVEGVCYAGSCCTGCWDGERCLTGTLSAACGTRGGACSACACPTNTCEEGECREGPPIVSTDAGSQHQCAVDASGRLFCWGSNRQSETGTGLAPTPVFEPTEIDCMPASGSTPGCSPDIAWSNVFTGGASGCALATDGTFACWGLNQRRELGFGDAVPATLGTPRPFEDGRDFRRAAMSPLYTEDEESQKGHFCWLDSDGAAWCSGANGAGQLGLGDLEARTVPFPVTAVVDRPNRYVEIAAASRATCAIDSDSALFCWGSNEFGQLGLGDRTIVDASTPRLVDDSSVWSDLRAGQRAFCAKRDDAVHCWGDNGNDRERGKLGVGNLSERIIESPTPLAHEGDVVAYDIGWDHGMLVDSMGRLFAWGSNGGHHRTLLPDPDESDSLVPYPRPTLVEGSDGGPDWVSVSTAQYHTCVLSRAGSIWCAGQSSLGQIGRGMPPPPSPVTSLTRVCLPPTE